MAETLKNLFRVNRYGGMLLIVLLAYSIGLLVLRFVLATSYLPETGGVSINILYGIVRIVHGEFLYSDPEQPPFAIIQYMPLHFQLIKFLSGITGNDGEIHGIMMVNRLFCLSMDLLTTFLLGRHLRRNFRLPPAETILLSILYFCCIPSILFGRADNLYLLFFLLAVLMMTAQGSPSTGWKKIAAAGMFTALSMLTKQTGIFLAFYLCFYLLFIERNRKSVMIFVGSVTLTFGSLLLLLQSGEWHDMKLNIIDGVRNGINANWFFEVIFKNFFLKFSYLLALGFLTGILLLKKREHNLDVFIGMGLFFYFIVASVTSFKAGSGPNYFLEFILLTLIGIGWLITQHKLDLRYYMPMAFVLVPFFIIASANDKGWGDLPQLRKVRQDELYARDAAGYVRKKIRNDEWVLNTFHKQSTINLQLADKALFPTREVALTFCKPMGVFHFNDFNRLVTQQKVGFIFDKKDHFPETFIEIPLRGFAPDTVIGNYAIYSLTDR